MGTRSRIGIINSDGTVDNIYCHLDGYLGHNGRILVDYYTTEDKIRQLIALGDISSLGQDIGTAHDFDHPPRGVCNAYGRDRGEQNVGYEHSADVAAFNALNEEYNYLWLHGRWMVSSYTTDDKWMLVEEAKALFD